MTITSAAAAAMSNHCAIITRSGAFLPRHFSRKVPSSHRPMTPFPSCYQRPMAARRYTHHEDDDAGTTTTTTTPSPCAVAVQVPPPPSWSIHQLRLTSSSSDDDNEIISKEELATLARRCLIDIRYLSPERREELRRHVGGIMRCASVLLESKELLNNMNDGCDTHGENEYNVCKNNRLTDEKVYDAPRGLTKMPLRRENNEDENTTWSMYDSNESMAIMKSQNVRSKMIIMSDNSEMFFSVVTKR